VTQYVDTAKQKVDNYRETRAETKAAELKKDAEIEAVNEDGFGAVTRTENGDTTKDELQKEKGSGFLDKTFALVTTLFNSMYTFVLWTISFVLGHPMLVQLAILLGILFTIIRLASKFGRRRNR
jgi:Flp pilus assembly protein TadB